VKLLAHRNVLSLVLAGGMGERLFPLTRDRAKPAVPFGGRYRIIDFVLSNFVNSGLKKIKVLTQFKSSSLIEHLIRSWRLSFDVGEFVDPVPAQMRRGSHWFRGTADAVYQNLDLIFDEEPTHVCVFGGDHIYTMDVNPMLSFHEAGEHDLDRRAARAARGGLALRNSRGRRSGPCDRLRQKPANPKAIPGNEGLALASMGNYVFRSRVLIDALEDDALRDTSHDFGKTIIPGLLAGGARIFAYDFATNRVPGAEDQADLPPYWRDVGTVDSYFEASMDLIAVTPGLNLYNPKWTVRSLTPQLAPAKFVFADKAGGRVGRPPIHRLGGLHRLGKLGPSLDPLSPGPRQLIRERRGVGAHGRRGVGRHAQLRRVIADKASHRTQRLDRLRPGGATGRFHVSSSGVVSSRRERFTSRLIA
jgi:glucose-1-phosphate adenylyltransferase